LYLSLSEMFQIISPSGGILLTVLLIGDIFSLTLIVSLLSSYSHPIMSFSSVRGTSLSLSHSLPFIVINILGLLRKILLPFLILLGYWKIILEINFKKMKNNFSLSLSRKFILNLYQNEREREEEEKSRPDWIDRFEIWIYFSNSFFRSILGFRFYNSSKFSVTFFGWDFSPFFGSLWF